MPSPDGLLNEKAFWRYYCAPGEDEAVVDPDLAEKFSVRENKGGSPSFRILIDCGGRYYFIVDVGTTYWGISLQLLDVRDNRIGELGWWDEARWHPFALRWEEVEILWGFWKRNPHFAPSPDLTVLLLAKFVGIPPKDAAGLRSAREKIEPIYRDLGCSPAEARELAAATLVSPTEEDYAWSKDPELGWVFEGEYSCYSLRNRDHSDGKEGQFPFQKLRDLLQSLRLR